MKPKMQDMTAMCEQMMPDMSEGMKKTAMQIMDHCTQDMKQLDKSLHADHSTEPDKPSTQPHKADVAAIIEQFRKQLKP
jgi:hypothetical protein